jgi:hypothetical protein
MATRPLPKTRGYRASFLDGCNSDGMAANFNGNAICRPNRHGTDRTASPKPFPGNSPPKTSARLVLSVPPTNTATQKKGEKKGPSAVYVSRGGTELLGGVLGGHNVAAGVGHWEPVRTTLVGWRGRTGVSPKRAAVPRPARSRPTVAHRFFEPSWRATVWTDLACRRNGQ